MKRLISLSLIAAAFSVVQASVFELSFVRKDPIAGFTGGKYVDVLAHPNHNFITLRFCSVNNAASSWRGEITAYTSAGTQVWSRSIFGAAGALGVSNGRMRVRNDGTIQVLAWGQSGVVAHLAADGTILSQEFAINPTGNLKAGELSQEGTAWFAYSTGDHIISTKVKPWELDPTIMQTDVVHEKGTAFERIRLNGAHTVFNMGYPYTVSTASGTPFGTITFGDTTEDPSCQFLFRATGEPWFNMDAKWSQFDGFQYGQHGHMKGFGRLSNTGSVVWFRREHIVQDDNFPYFQYFGDGAYQSGIGPNKSYRTLGYSINQLPFQQNYFSHAYDDFGKPITDWYNGGDGSHPNGPAIAEISINRHSYYTTIGQSWDNPQNKDYYMFRRYLTGASIQDWSALGQCFSPLSWQTMIVSGTFGDLIVTRYKDSDGSIMARTKFTGTVEDYSAVAQEPWSGDTFVVGTQDGQPWMARILQAPIANNDIYVTQRNVTLNAASVEANDRFAGGLAPEVTVAPKHGTVTMHDDGTFVFVPRALFVGNDMFTYRVKRSDGLQSTAIVTVRVK